MESAANTAKSPEMASAESASSTKVASTSCRSGPESERNGRETSGSNQGEFLEHSLRLHKRGGWRGKSAPEHWFQGWGLVLRLSVLRGYAGDDLHRRNLENLVNAL